MEPLTTLEGVMAALPLANVDTDMILAAQFMKTTGRKGLGRHLFHALRVDDAGRPKRFMLDQLPWNAARFLVALDNFGCGSSREHAPWALLDFGIRCVIAPSFADIFSNNCIKNGILPLVLDRTVCETLIADAAQPSTARLSLDLPAETVVRTNGETITLHLAPEKKRRLVEGLDEIQQTFHYLSAIADHEGALSYPRPALPLGRDLRTIRVHHSGSGAGDRGNAENISPPS